ncbi:MAG: hypothetical protein FJW14_11460 [Acidimicrobiia bacterium]|nr:hypothetical protein [Acidimicrobiia bacterium]
MRRTAGWWLGILLALIVGASAVDAHHSFFAEYDRNQPLTIEGVVSRVEWTNPHVRFFPDVTGRNGRVTIWELSGAAAAMLSRQGVTEATIKVGDAIRVDGFRALDGSPRAAAGAVTLPNRKRIFTGSLQELTPI